MLNPASARTGATIHQSDGALESGRDGRDGYLPVLRLVRCEPDDPVPELWDGQSCPVCLLQLVRRSVLGRATGTSGARGRTAHGYGDVRRRLGLDLAG